jgi:hypothetical protein
MSALFQLQTPILCTMKPLAILLALLLVATPDLALAANGNGNGNGQGNTGHGQGQNNGSPPGQNSGNGNTENGQGQNNGDGATGGGAQSGGSDGSDSSSAILSPEGEVTIGADQNIALDALKAGLALPLIESERRAVARWGGRVLDARPYLVGNALLYRLTLISSQGVARRVLVDARNGNPIGPN